MLKLYLNALSSIFKNSTIDGKIDFNAIDQTRHPLYEFQDLGGCELLFTFQNHPNQEIYNKCNEILKTYYPEDNELEMAS